MTKILVTALLLISFLKGMQLTHAQTNVSGFISSNTSWSLSGSPYIVTGNMIVSSGVTLTVDPGVMVKFDQDKAIQVDGELHAVGTAQDRITFTSNQPTPAAGDWAKIQFTPSSDPTSYDANGNYLSGCILKYCDFLYGGNLGSGEIHIQTSAFYIGYCKFLYSFKDGIFSETSALKIESSTLSHCAERGLNIHGNSSDCGLILSNDTISFNSQAGVNLLGGACNAIVTESYFDSNGNNGAFYCPGNVNNIKIKNNIFSNNTSCIWIPGSTGELVQCNKFYNNTSSPLMVLSNTATVRDNVFKYNSGSLFNFYSINYSPLTFTNNYITNNHTASHFCDFTFSSPNTLCVIIEHNIFKDNTGISAIHLGGTGSTNPNLDIISFKSNSFDDPQSQFELDNDIPWGTSNIHADSNYWGGSNSSQHCDSVIYDYFDYANSSVVFYTNNLIFDIRIDTACAGINTAIDELVDADNVADVFPNPATDMINVVLKDSRGKMEIELFDMIGKSVYRNTFREAEYSFDVSNFKQGIYLLKINTEYNSVTKKILIQ
jgi:hypothetical protein